MVRAPFKTIRNILMRHGKTMKYYTKLYPDDNRIVLLPLKRKAHLPRQRHLGRRSAPVPLPRTPPATSAAPASPPGAIPQPQTPPAMCGPTQPSFPPPLAADAATGAPRIFSEPVSRSTRRIAARVASAAEPASSARGRTRTKTSSATSLALVPAASAVELSDGIASPAPLLQRRALVIAQPHPSQERHRGSGGRTGTGAGRCATARLASPQDPEPPQRPRRHGGLERPGIRVRADDSWLASLTFVVR